MQKATIRQSAILPDSPDWNLFLNLSVDYLCENFPSVLDEGMPKETFLRNYEQQLLSRFQEGGRVLLVWSLAGNPLGFANAWVLEKDGETCMHIAEFSVLEKYRRKGFGKLFVQKLMEVAHQGHATKILAEVDEGIEATYFWDSIMGNHTHSETKGRDLYWKVI